MTNETKAPRWSRLMQAASLDYIGDVLNAAIADEVISEAQAHALMAYAETNPTRVMDGPIDAQRGNRIMSEES